MLAPMDSSFISLPNTSQTSASLEARYKKLLNIASDRDAMRPL